MQFETSVGPLADLSEARWTSLSLVSSAGQILSAKIEEDGQRVKRRRMMRKLHLDDAWSAKKFARPGRCVVYDL